MKGSCIQSTFKKAVSLFTRVRSVNQGAANLLRYPLYFLFSKICSWPAVYNFGTEGRGEEQVPPSERPFQYVDFPGTSLLSMLSSTIF